MGAAGGGVWRRWLCSRRDSAAGARRLCGVCLWCMYAADPGRVAHAEAAMRALCARVRERTSDGCGGTRRVGRRAEQSRAEHRRAERERAGGCGAGSTHAGENQA